MEVVAGIVIGVSLALGAVVIIIFWSFMSIAGSKRAEKPHNPQERAT